MALGRLFKQELIAPSHLPTWMLLIGTVVFWLELYVIKLPGGQTTWLAWLLLVAVRFIAFKGHGATHTTFDFKKLLKQRGPSCLLVLMGIYIGIVLYAALLPTHLSQEHDAINYHIMVPRQHLLWHSFDHISWSVADLFLLPLDYALSPFWLVSPLPNKFPQFFFFIGIIVLVYRIVCRMGKQSTTALYASAAVMALHIVAIQAGTAMMDMVMLYCVLAATDSVLNGRYGMAAIEGAFFFWSKSFFPVLLPVLFIALCVILWILKQRHFKLADVYVPVMKGGQKMGVVFLLASIIIAGPALVKSWYYLGSPIFGIKLAQPVATYEPEQWASISSRIDDHIAIKDSYGHGRSLMDFIKHLWLIAVPEKGVNNAFDYPVGLIYLICLLPFLVAMIKALRQKIIPLMSLAVIGWWVLWWMGSQQSRFLLIPICLMVIITFIYLKKISNTFKGIIFLCLLLEIGSLINAHKADWGKSPIDVLRDQDKHLVALGVSTEPRVLYDPDVAFAAFPVIVQDNKESIFVLPR